MAPFLNGDSVDGHTPNSDLTPVRPVVNDTAVNGQTPHGTFGFFTNEITSRGDLTNGHSPNDAAHSSAGVGGGNPIAICGMAVRLPGGIMTPQQMWEFLMAKGDARTRVPETRYNVSAYHSKTPKPGSVITEYGCFLDESVDLGALDTTFFHMPRSEVERADPQQRLMLEVARECFEDAGITNWRGRTIGCYMGSFGEDWVEMFAKEPQQWGMHRIVGYGDFALSNRVSYEMDLQGPSMTLRTGCSAALTGLNEACLAIQRGDCEAALVGGVNLVLGPGMTTAMSEQGVLSKDGSCKTFSADANGYARGEAITALYVKPLNDAIKDGNPVRAVIRATAINVDGKTPGMSMPSTITQEAMMRRAYKLAGISEFGQTAMVECHGTGTPVGDPIEANAVARVFGDSGVYIGSVKPNLGHAEGASGLVSVIKMVLALEHRTIPPNIRFTSPNPAIPFEAGKLTVPLEPTVWPQSRQERVSVNSFGIGGANAHVILDSAASFNASPKLHRAPITSQLLLFSAMSPKSLVKMTVNYERFVQKHSDHVGDLAYTLANNREHLPHRTFAIANNGVVGTITPPTKVGRKPNLVMVFTGQGAQWPLMGRELLQSNKIFKSSIQSLDHHLQDLAKGVSQYSIEEELLKSGKKSRLNEAELSQPLCTVVQIALIDTFKSFAVEPDAVVGHSSGEIAAAYAVGALTAKEAIITAHHRGAVTTRQERPGAMAAIGMGWEETEKYLLPKVTIACHNSSKSVTISGDADDVKAVVADIQESRPDVLAKLLQVDKAYHSYHMAEIGDSYRSLIGTKMVGKELTKLFFSSVLGKLLSGERNLGSRYWQDNLESPVLYDEAVSAILQHETGQNAVFLEIGPHSALAGPSRQIFTQASCNPHYVSAMVRNQNCIESLLAAIGKLHSSNVTIDLKAVIPTGSCLPDLPRYPWNHENSYWCESRISKEWRLRKHPYHDLVGVRVSESTDIEPVWRNLLHLQNAPWLSDHKVGDDIVFPFAGYIALTGEAVKQISGIDEGFILRNVTVNTALILLEDKPTEIMTAFRQHRLTSSLNSQWWEYTISAYNGHVWTKHCSGEVVAFSSSLGRAVEPESLPRKVGAQKWYDTTRRAGLDIGPCFQPLETVDTSTDSQQGATGRVINGRQGDEANYHIHPTVLDGALQLVGAAAISGHTRKYKNWLPTSIEKVTISRCYTDLMSSVSGRATSNSSLVGEGRCISEGRIVLEISGIRFSLAEASLSADNDMHAAGRYEWGTDIDFLDLKGSVTSSEDNTQWSPLLDDLGKLCLLYSKRSLFGSESNLDHMQKYLAWIKMEAQATDLSAYDGLDNETLSSSIEDLAKRLLCTPAAPAATALQQVCTGLNHLMPGQTLESILSIETISNLYNSVDQCDRSRFIQYLGHSKPHLRILEIGVGRSCCASSILRDLTMPGGQVRCAKYTLTSTGFISAKDQSMSFQNMEHVTLNISQDLEEQGFDGRQYDLILAINALHTTKRLQESLANVKRLLHPDGLLLLQELCPSSKWVNYIFGLLPSWWCGSTDGRQNEPYISTERWRSELSTAGFDHIQSTILDSEKPHQLTAVMIAKPVSERSIMKRVTLLGGDSGNVANQVVKHLEESGFEVVKCTIEETPPAGQNVISLLDLDGPYFETMDEARFQSFRRFILDLGDSGVLWLTPLCQIGCQDPRFAQMIGLARTIRTEMLIDFATCEVDDFASSAHQIAQVLSKFNAREDNDKLKPDCEYAIRDGEVNIGRVYPFSLQKEILTSHPSDKASLDIGTPGRLNTLRWSGQPAIEPHGDQVEVEVYAAGLNFRLTKTSSDVLVGMGIVELPDRVFGLEASGVVRRLGPEVKGLKIGDRVACLEKHAFSTFITGSESFCVKLPEALTFDEAATMIIPYVTVIHSLITIGGLVEEHSVLIHSACGGVGLAAIQISKMVGASIFVTVSNEEKVNYLIDTFDIPRNKIFNSRDSSFVDGIMRETGGASVDLVLNSLSRELLHATWTCVAAFGKLVEIGKRDLIGGGRPNMSPFLANRSYCCVDIDQFRNKPLVLKQLLEDTMRYFKTGQITPVRPVRIFDINETEDAFRYMQKGQHIGRIGVSIRKSPETTELGIQTMPRTRTASFNSSASYLLVGGLGGLGRAVSRWMVDHGARQLIYLSRRAGADSEDDDFINELNSMSCDVKLVQGDVTKADDVAKAIAAATKPVKGLLQMSMVLRDRNFRAMTFEEWNAVVRPKVQGTWNLHNATVSAGIDLDFFVAFSSLSGIFGQPGQANYASANAFLDAFTQYRHGLGLKSSVIDLGSVEDVGFLSQNTNLMEQLRVVGFTGVKEQTMLDAMTAATSSNKPDLHHSGRHVDKNQLIIGIRSATPLSSPSNRAVWRKDRRMAIYHNESNEDGDAKASNEGLKTCLAGARANPSILKTQEASHTLAVEISKKLFELLLRPQEELNTSWPLVDLGLDSLVALGLRAWWKQVFGFDISVLEMLGMGSLETLGTHAAELRGVEEKAAE